MSSNKEIKGLRKRIDEVDQNIIELLNLRAQAALKISEYKQLNSFEIYDPVRENEVMGKIEKINNGPLTPYHLTSIYKQIISVCRTIQEPVGLTVLGPKGSYSHQVASKMMGDSVQVEPVSTIEDVFTNVEKGVTPLGVLPIENSLEGSVGVVLDRLLDTDLKICSEFYERISHSILSKKGTLKDVKVVASHPQAIGQCRKWLGQNLNVVEYREVSSTARAAQIASEDPRVAAIAGEFNSNIYDLKVIENYIEDSPSNTTRFVLIGYKENRSSRNDKTSIVFSLKDEPGALSNALLPFEKANINLTKIESRPSRQKPWEYVFFVDFEGHISDESVLNVLKSAEKSCIFLKVFGSYPVGGH